MLFFIWMCVMTQAFLPGGQQLSAMQVAQVEARIRAEIESPIASGALIGAASHVTRLAPRTLPRVNAVERAIYAR